jgi:CHAT domain-containing protein
MAGTEGLIGLPRAFLLAGARRVIATSVDVGDLPTAGLMHALYKGLQHAADNPARALLSAQRALLGNPKTSWPGAWATFFVVGPP